MLIKHPEVSLFSLNEPNGAEKIVNYCSTTYLLGLVPLSIRLDGSVIDDVADLDRNSFVLTGGNEYFYINRPSYRSVLHNERCVEPATEEISKAVYDEYMKQ